MSVECGVYLLRIRNKCGYCNFVILAEHEALPFSVKHTFSSGHVPVMSWKLPRLGPENKGEVKAPKQKIRNYRAWSTKKLGSTLSHIFDSQVPVPLYWYAVYVADSVLCAFLVISKTINNGRPFSSS